MTRARILAGTALVFSTTAAIAAGCGARSDLADVPSGTGGGTAASSSTTATTSSATTSVTTSTTSGPPCLSDADCDDMVGCTIDACTPGGCVHTPDNGACDDGVFCTLDVCDPVADCQSTFTDAVCDDGIACTSDTCDMASDECRHDACDGMCDDGVFCNGVERCDTAFGCVAGPPACELQLTCSMDSCTESNQTCHHPGASTCAPSVRLLVTDANSNLLSVSPYGGPPMTIAPSMSSSHYDVAILNGRWFTIESQSEVLELYPMTNKIKKAFMSPTANSLGAGPDGMLYAASTNIYRIDPDTGASSTIGALPPGYTSSGDIAFLGTRMFISTDGPCGGSLVEFDPTSGVATVLGGDGLGCVYGLAVSGGTMFILDCSGKIGTFDPDTGVARVLSTPNITVYGADTLP